MVSGMRTGCPRGLNKGLGSKFRDGSRLRQDGSRVLKESKMFLESEEVPEEIPCTDNSEDEDNSPNKADNTNHQASSQTSKEVVALSNP